MDREQAPPPPRFRPLRDEADFERFIAEFTNYERMKEYRYAGDTLSLERMAGLLRDLGDPQDSGSSIHIAGTKGKGSTSLILEALLSSSGHAVGSYTSPHVEHLRERIRFGGECISGEELCRLASGILPVLEARHRLGPTFFPTFFELMTALAMLHFRGRSAEWCIFEVGLGGRLDATNVLRPRATAITSIGLEHTDKLGETLALIAGEKAGIVKDDTPLLLGPVPAEAESVILAIARRKCAPVERAAPHLVQAAGPESLSVGGPELGFEPHVFRSGPVRGPALRLDLTMALQLWRRVLSGAGRSPAPEDIERALARLELPARVEVFPGRPGTGSPPAVIDGAHTPESVRALSAALEELAFPRPRVLVFGLALDKNLDSILDELPRLAEEVIFTRADPARGRDPAEIAARFQTRLGRTARTFEDPEEAWEAARRTGRSLVATGSFYLAGRLRRAVRDGPVRDGPVRDGPVRDGPVRDGAVEVERR